MPKICYVPKRFNKLGQTRIDQANTIISEYDAQGFKLTLRQLYYQFVSRDLIPNFRKKKKHQKSDSLLIYQEKN